MSTLAQKMDKHFDWQRTRHSTSADPMDLFVSVDDLVGYLAAQTRADERTVRRAVKTELERRADNGLVYRWAEVHGASLRADRADHYFLPA
uniref:hypothetical protein n=1 Tax=Paractinoplanes polyasparticus TaxID=2856853 RepID=UPI001C8553B0|nr:hypothetical protein [Actinoplanes polyasparticus]